MPVVVGEKQSQHQLQKEDKSSPESESSSNENNINNNGIDTHRGKFVTAQQMKKLINFYQQIIGIKWEIMNDNYIPLSPIYQVYFDLG